MTDIQIKYWDLQEGRRHNQAVEYESHRHNTVTEVQNDRSIAEIGRHNLAMEKETNRHNVVTEGQQDRVISETVRHNYATEGIQRIQARASQDQARAALRQAAVAERNVSVTERMMPYNMALTAAKSATELERGQSAAIDNDIRRATRPTEIVGTHIANILNPVTDAINSVTNIFNASSNRTKAKKAKDYSEPKTKKKDD